MAHFLLDTNVDGLSQNQMTVLLLIKVSEYFKTKKVGVNSNTRLIVQLFETGTTVSEIKPKIDEPPRLIGIGTNNMPNLTFALFVDGEAIFSDTAIEALLQMYALYWVFNIEYPSDAKAAYTFISAVLFRKKVQQYYTKYRTIINILEQLDLS